MKYRIKNKRKFERFIILNILIVTLFVFFAISVIGPNYVEGSNDYYNTIIVRQGDTIWSIADTINTDKDIRELVYEIQKINGIRSEIVPGSKLIIPKS